MPPGVPSSAARREAGTASVELIAVLPFLLLVALVAAQLALAGQALWSAGIAARAGARASLVGRPAKVAARAVLPSSMRAGARVQAPATGTPMGSGGAGRAVSVRVFVPRIAPGLPRVPVEASANLLPGPDGGGDGR